MKPRQTLKNFHQGSSAQPQPPSYQHQSIHHGGAHPLQQAPPPASGSSLRDLDLAKLGLNLDDLAILQGNNTNQEELIKCIQALYNKNSSQANQPLSDSLQKLPPNNDWPMQSVSPPDFPRVVGGGSGGAVGACSSANSALAGCNVSATDGGGASGAASFSNFIDNGNSNQQRQDIQFANAQQQQHPASALAINHHRFRVNTTPQDQLSQQQKSVLSLHQHHQNDSSNRRMNHNLSTTNTSFANFNAASTISSSANPDTNSSLTSLAGVGKNNNNTNINSSTNNLPAHVSNIMDNIGSPMDNIFYDNSLPPQQQTPMNKDTSSNQSLTKHQQLQRLLKATGNHFRTQSGGVATASSSSSSTSTSTSTSNYSHRNDSQRFINNNMSQIQRQLTSPSSTAISHTAQQPATLPAVPKSLLNLAACSSSPAASSSTNASSSLSSATPLQKNNNNNNSNNNSNNQLSNMLNSRQQEVMRQAANLIHNNPNISYTSNSRTLARNTPSGNIINNNNPININCASNNLKSGLNGIDAANLLQQMARHAAPGSNHTASANNLPGPPTRSSLRQQLQQSLLSDDQSSSSRNNLRQSGQSLSNLNNSTQNKPFLQQHNMIHQRQQSTLQTGDDLSLSGDQSTATKEAFLSSLQERAARAGVSIGEINKPLQAPNNNIVQQQNNTASNRPNQLQQLQQDTLSVTSNQLKDNTNQQGEQESFDRKEIESALSRVEARNDLSLLYPPVLLASSSQKQINALSAGIQSPEESELFTKEVRKIVLEECNIIYECKGCNNLFRSLANLVRHKRTYCIENSLDQQANIESMNRRANNMSNVTPTAESATIHQNNNPTDMATTAPTNLANFDRIISTPNNTTTTATATTIGTRSQYNSANTTDSTQQANQKYNLRGRRPDFQALNDSRALRIIQRKGHFKDKSPASGAGGQVNNPERSGMSSPVAQTSLSKLLQSQPKNRLPVNRDSALMGALNNISSGTTSTSISSRSSANNTSLQIFTNSDRNLNVNELNEQLVRNSSLAKTLLNENAKSFDTTTTRAQSFLEASKGSSSSASSSDGTRATMTAVNPLRQTSLIQGGGKRVMKRKGFSLEACIQKVKRDKIRNDDDSQDNAMAIDSADEPATDSRLQHHHNHLSSASSHMINQPLDDSRLIKDPLAVDDSDADSDMLMIDLDAPNTSSTSHRSLLSKRSTRRTSITTASSTASSSSSTMKLNSSSALLKALTRPVDNSGKPFNTSATSSSVANIESKGSTIICTDERSIQKEKTHNAIAEPNIAKKERKEQLGQQPDRDITDEPMNSMEVCDLQEQIPVPSPLFDKYTCDICTEDFSDHETLMSHTLEKHIDEKMVYPCIFCSLSFITIENACRHIIDFHKKPKTQVRRLREVIKSRSHTTNDFLACSDHPPAQDKTEDQPYPVESSVQPDESTEASVVEQQAAGTDLQAMPLVDNASNTIVSSLSSSSSPNAESDVSGASMISQAGSSQSFQDEDHLEVEGEEEDENANPNDEDNQQDINEDNSDFDQQGDVNSQDAHESRIDAFKSDSDLQKFMPDNFDELNSGFEHEDSHDIQEQQPDVIEAADCEQQVGVERPQTHEPPHSGKSIRMSRRSSSRAVSEDAIGDPSEANSENNDEDDDEDEDNEEEDQEEDEEEDEQDNEDDDDDDNTNGEAEQDNAEFDNQDEDEEGEDEEEDDGGNRLDIGDAEEASPEAEKSPDGTKSSSQATHTSTPTSSSSGGGSGGIMKLKIQLKTRPDEKSKVYRIV